MGVGSTSWRVATTTATPAPRRPASHDALAILRVGPIILRVLGQARKYGSSTILRTNLLVFSRTRQMLLKHLVNTNKYIALEIYNVTTVGKIRKKLGK